MTTLNFVETLKVLMPDQDIEDDTQYAKFLDWSLSNEGMNVKIRGKIPYEVAMAVYENYPCEKLGIKVGRIGLSCCPTEFFTDEFYNYELNRDIKNESTDSRMRRLNRERQRLARTSNKNKYLEMYRVDTKEGLVVILKELSKYYYAKVKKQDVEELDIDEVLSQINEHILERIKPWTSIHSWMMQTIAVEEYFKGWNRMKSTPMLREFRRALDEFDRAVNPFIERDLSTKEIVSDLKGKEIKAYPFNYNDEYKDELQFYEVHINNEDPKSSSQFGIKPVGFYYSYSRTLGEKEYLLVSHFYSVDSREENRGEILTIDYFGDNMVHKKKIRLNLTNLTVGEEDEKKRPVTEMELANIYLELIKATGMAADLTVNNFSKNKATQLVKS